MLKITSFDDIYCLNLTIKQDKRLSKLPINKYYSLCWKYLQFAISYFQYDCLPAEGKTTPKVLDNVPYQEMDYDFLGNGEDSQFLLNPAPPQNCLFYILYKNTENSEYITLSSDQYIFDSETNIITLNISAGEIYEVIISAYSVGYFNDDLDYREKNILAEGMLIPYLEETTNDYMTRKQMIFNDSSRIHSQANHQQYNIEGEKNRYLVLDRLITDYSYRSNRENYVGMSGIKTLGGHT